MGPNSTGSLAQESPVGLDHSLLMRKEGGMRPLTQPLPTASPGWRPQSRGHLEVPQPLRPDHRRPAALDDHFSDRTAPGDLACG